MILHSLAPSARFSSSCPPRIRKRSASDACAAGRWRSHPVRTCTMCSAQGRRSRRSGLDQGSTARRILELHPGRRICWSHHGGAGRSRRAKGQPRRSNQQIALPTLLTQSRITTASMQLAILHVHSQCSLGKPSPLKSPTGARRRTTSGSPVSGPSRLDFTLEESVHASVDHTRNSPGPGKRLSATAPPSCRTAE